MWGSLKWLLVAVIGGKQNNRASCLLLLYDHQERRNPTESVFSGSINRPSAKNGGSGGRGDRGGCGEPLPRRMGSHSKITTIIIIIIIYLLHASKK